MLSLSQRFAISGLLCCACSGAHEDSGPPDGAALFKAQNCVQCHAPDGSGTNLGPTLHGKKGYWTRERIAAYIAKPSATIAGDERLKQQAAKYALPMVDYPYLTPAQRLALADYVLALP
jgi:mono/diheme cytochrome c family protein